METIAEFIARTARERQEREAAAAGLVISTVDKNPDQFAGDMALAQQWAQETGRPMPPMPLVEEYRPVFQQQIEQRRNAKVLAGNPKLSAFLRDPQNAALAKDDLENMGAFEATVNAVKRFGMSFPQTYNQAMAARFAGQAADAQRSFGEIVYDEREPIIVDGVEVARALPGPVDALSAGWRYLTSRWTDLVTDPEAQAQRYQMAAGEMRRRIADTPMTADAQAIGQRAMSINTGSIMGDVAAFGELIAEDPLSFASFLAQVSAESLPAIGASLGVGLATRDPRAAAVTMGALSGVREYGASAIELIEEKGYDPTTPEGALAAIRDEELMREANERGLTRAVVIGAMDTLSFAVAGVRLADNQFLNVAAQSVAQAAMGASGEALGQVASGQRFNIVDVILEGVAEFITGPVDVGVAGVTVFRENQAKARFAANRRAQIEAIAQQSAQSKLRARMPDVFRAWVERATENGPAENLYVPADKFTEYFQSIGMDPYALADEMDGVSRSDLETALATGGDLRIPTATYAAKLAGSEADQFFMENMRFDPDEFTSAEARAFEDTKAELMAEAMVEAERIFAEQQELRTFEEEIYDNMVSRLRAAGRATDVATTEAALYPAFYKTWAAKTGIPLGEFIRRYPLPQVRGDIPQGMQAKNVDDLTRTLATARAARQAGVNQPKTPLLEFISNYGGISDRGGELAARDATVIKRGPFRKTLRLLRDTGPDGQASMFGMGEGGKKFGPDDVAQAAIEAGLMADNPVVMEYKAAIERGDQIPDITRALWDEIDRELRGEATMTDEDMNAGPSQDEQIAELERYLGEIGVSLDDDDAVIRAAIERDQAEQRRMYGQDGRIATDSEAFKAWFGDSVVVDDAGNPLVVYHGTDRQFEAFNADAPSATGVTTRAFFFTESQGVADGYGDNVMPVYLKIESPVELDFGGKSRVFFDGEMRSPSELAARISEIAEDVSRGALDPDSDLRYELEEAGWDYLGNDKIDGLILKNVDDTMDMFGGEVTTHYVAFSPTQIKSVNNRGTFDASDPRIYYQFAGPQSETADIHALARAKDMIAGGASAEQVRRETGWFRGPDMKWRYEISDEDARFSTAGIVTPEDVAAEIGDEIKVAPDPKNPDLFRATWGEGQDYTGAFGRSEQDAIDSLLRAIAKKRTPADAFNPNNIKSGSEYALGDILDHDRLFAAYPDLKMIPVRFDSDLKSWGAVNGYGSEMTLNADRIKAEGGENELLSTILHEVQHLIQRREGFARGGNTEMSAQVNTALQKLVQSKQGEVSRFENENRLLFMEADEARRMVGYANMFQDFDRLMGYSRMDRPSGVFRHIRNATQWFHTPIIRENADLNLRASELYRSLYALPRRGPKRNAFLRQFSFDLAQLLREAVPPARWEMLTNDPRKTTSMLKALEREASRASAKLKPHYELKKDARIAKDQADANQYRSPFEVYQLLAGEVEARNTQNRAAMTDEERRDTPPEATMTVDRDRGRERISTEDVIVVMQTGEIDTPFIANIEAPEGQVTRLLGGARERIARRNLMADRIAEDGRPVVMSNGELRALVGPNTIASEKPFRVTYMGADGQPNGHVEAATLRDAAIRAMEDGFAPEGRTYGQAARTIEVDGIELPVNPDGTVTVYHGTTAEAADMIVRAGVLRSAAEPSVYVTTAVTGETGYGDGTVVAVDVMPSMLRLDGEFPDGRADFAIDRPAVRVVRARIVAGGSGKTYNQPAYHGSPHLFERFSLGAIGTGEGAQAFGWGLYFAGRREVAEYYKTSLANGWSLNVRDPIREAGITGRDLDSASQMLSTSFSGAAAAADWENWTGKTLTPEQRAAFDVAFERKGGRLFEVDIPEDAELLDWDAPLSKQPEAVREKLEALIEELRGARMNEFDRKEILSGKATAEQFYRAYSQHLATVNKTGTVSADRAASEALRAAGIPGHRYLDGGSRADGDGTRNYVIYDDTRIQVTRFEQEQRGSVAFPSAGVGNGDTVISLFRKADLSTFLHESGHYFLTVLQDMAGKGEASAVAEFETIKAWWRSNAQAVAKDAMRVMPDVKVTEADVIAALDNGTTGNVLLDAAIDVGMQEQFARSFEAYLMEGKAPSVELRGAFERFRAWLLSVYRSLRGLNVEIDDNIRAVFDRMLATDQEIAEARTQTGDRGPMFTEAPAGMSPEDWARYQAIGQAAQDEAAARLLAETMAPIRREQEQAYRAEKEAVLAEVEPQVNARREYRAIEWMGNRRWLGADQPQGLPDMRLDRQTLVDRYGEGVLKTLPRGKFTLYANDGGVDPEIAAGLFGFGSADEMIRALERAPKRAEAIAAEVEKLMFERHGDPLRDGTVEAKAIEAVHGDKRARMLAIELDVLRAAPGGTKSAVAVFREMARVTLAGMRVRDAMAANRYLTAERKAGEASYRAAANGDMQAAAEAKRRQLLNHMLYTEARKIEAEVEAAEKLAARLQKKSTREKLAGDYLEAIDEILGRYDFRRLSGKAEDRRGALHAYVERMKAEGRENELAIPERVLQDAERTPYKRLTVEHLRGVVDSLKNIEHTARLKQKLIDAQSQRDLDAVVDDILGAFDANVKERAPGRVGTTGERLRAGTRAFLDLVLNAGTLLREIDGFSDLGPAFSNLKAPIDAAMNRLQARREKAAMDLDALYDVYTKDERRKMAVRQFVPEIGASLSKWERIAVALNMGNEGNYQRLTDTKVRGGFTEAQVKAIVAGLDERDARFVQSVWDYLETFRGDIEAREKRVTGVAPKWVEARPVQIAGIDLRGGYYPLKYDPRLSSLARDDAAQDIAKSLQAGRFGKAQTRNGHLKERATSSGRPVELDISVLHRHVQQVVYDLELSEPVANSWRILQDGRIRDAFVNAGKQADFDALEIWLKDVAEGELRAGDVAGQMARRFKSNFTAAKLAFNLSTVAVQITGVAQSMVVVGKADFLKGVQMALRPGIRDEVHAKSQFMRDRSTTFNKDIFDLYNDPRLGPVASRWTEIRNDWIAPAGFWLMTKVQSYLVDVPTWLAGYQQGLRKFGGDEAKAVAYADAIVKRSQASGIFSDRSAVERGSASMRTRQNEFLRLFTTLGSYMFAKFNVAYERTGRARQVIEREGLSLRSAQEAVSWTIDVAFLFTLEAVLYAAIKGRLPDEEDDEDDDGMTDEWAAYLAKETALSFMSTMPFVRDIGSVLTGFGGGGAYGAITEELAKPLIQAGQGEVDAALVKSVISATGLFTGLPSGQINRAVDAGWRQAEGEQVSPAEYLLGRIGK